MELDRERAVRMCLNIQQVTATDHSLMVIENQRILSLMVIQNQMIHSLMVVGQLDKWLD
jgi:hypothetical protein